MAQTGYMLALDLGSPNGSLALFDGEACLECRIVSTGRDHSEQLVSELDSLLKRHHVSISRIDRFLLSSGPGSYTGLRVAFATFKAFAKVGQKPLLLVSGSEVRALSSGRTCIRTRMTATKSIEEVFELAPGTSGELSEDEEPLTAEMLGKFYTSAKSLQVCETSQSIIVASPQYAGSSF